MQFPLSAGAGVDVNAGLKTLESLNEARYDVPVIVCSSDSLNISDVIGCIHYSPRTDMEMEFKTLLAKL